MDLLLGFCGIFLEELKSRNYKLASQGIERRTRMPLGSQKVPLVPSVSMPSAKPCFSTDKLWARQR